MTSYRERVLEMEAPSPSPTGGAADVYFHGWYMGAGAAARIASEADARVAELEAELSGMVAAVELAAREEAAAKRDAAYWRKRGYDAERIASEADARVAELEAALPDPEMLETIATTRGQLSYDARDALCAAAERIRLALAATDVGAVAGTGTGNAPRSEFSTLGEYLDAQEGGTL